MSITNELLFLMQTLLLAISCAGTLFFGKEALCAFICLQTICANLFVSKQIILFGFHATASDAFSVAAAIGITLLQEKFGFEIAKRTIWISFYLMIVYTAISQLHLAYAPSALDMSQLHYQTILSIMPRIISASLIAFFASQLIDTYLYKFLKAAAPSKSFALLGIISVATSQLCDTFLFTFLALSSINSHWMELTLVSYTIKMIASGLIILCLRLGQKMVPNKEQNNEQVV